MRENEAADIIWLNGYNVVQLAQRSNAQGVKQPDFRIEAEIFDAFAPKTDNVRNVWKSVYQKVTDGQSNSIVINLIDSTLTAEQLTLQFRTYKIPGLKTVLIIDSRLQLHLLIGEF